MVEPKLKHPRTWLLLSLIATAALVAGLLARHRLAAPRDSPPGASGPGPSATAVVQPRCGNGHLEIEEICDPPGEVVACTELVTHAVPDLAVCDDACTWDLTRCAPSDAACGNGVLEAGELCDDGNLSSGDGCDATCLVEVDGRSVNMDGPAIDTHIQRALARSVCRDPSVRDLAPHQPRQRVEYQLWICQTPSGEDVYPLGRIRQAMAAAAGELRGAGIELAEDGLEHFQGVRGCTVAWGATELRARARESRARRTLPIFFVRDIRGGDVPGVKAAGFAAFGHSAVLGSTDPEVITHELGHLFGLLHTHACLAAHTAGQADGCTTEGDGLCDTPFDPGPGWLRHSCPGRPAESCPAECGAEPCSGGTVPDRTNTMSYFSGCRTGFSADQLALMRCVLDHELAWLHATDDCGTELCNGVDDDCNGQVDDAGACRVDCRSATPLEVGVVEGDTRGYAEAYGGDLYPEGTPDVLYELRPPNTGRYCLDVTPTASAHDVSLGPIVAWRDGCAWDAEVLASNLEASDRRLLPRLEVGAGPDRPAWVSVDGWGRSDGVSYRIEVRPGPCSSAAPLEIPRLLEPGDGARLPADEIRLRWEPVPGAEAYELRLGTELQGLRDDPACTECDAQIVDATTIELTGIAPSQTVFWTVRALRGDAAGHFARPRSVSATRPRHSPRLYPPRLREPRPNAELPSLLATFTWDAVEGATGYEVRIGLDASTLDDDACQQCIGEVVTTPGFQPTPLVMAPGLDYFWTVRAGRSGEWGPFANRRPFTVEDWVCTAAGRDEIPLEQEAFLAPHPDDLLVPSCGLGSSAEHVWLVVPPVSGPLCIDTEGSEVDTLLSVRARCDDAATELACNDEGSAGHAGPSRLRIDAQADLPLFIIVEGTGAHQSGVYRLRVRPCL